MNAERLHAVAIAISEELRSTNERGVLEQLAQAMRRAVNEPAQPAHQVQAAELRAQLNEILRSAPSNSFSAAWRDTLDEVGAREFMGEDLRLRVEAIFAEHEVTPAAATEALEGLTVELGRFESGLDTLLTGLEYFDIGSEQLDAGEFEIGFLIPRPAVRSELRKLGEEFVELEEILGPILELATGTVPEIRVRTISSSEFQVFLEAIPQVATVLSQILDALVVTFERIKRLKDMYTASKDAGDPDTVVEPIKDFANQVMDIDVQALAEKLIEAHGGNLRGDGRDNEVTVAISHSIRAIAGRMDEGYTIEVRTYTLPSGTEDEALPEGATPEAEEARRSIAERQPRMRADISGTPILRELGEGDMTEPGGEPADE